jgi:uncharacterized membrane protein YjjB (DUF3815 family)
MTIFLSIIASFIVPYSFAILYNIPKTEYICCGTCGLIGWLAYLFIMSFSVDNSLIASLATSLIVVFLSRILANVRKKPVMVFLLPGIVNLVPGAALFDAMFSVVENNHIEGIEKIITSFETAGTIGLGIIIIFALPEKIFKVISSMLRHV